MSVGLAPLGCGTRADSRKDDVHAVLGHSLGELQATYMAGPGYRRKKAALQAWADYVFAAVESEADDKVVPLRSGGQG